MDDLERKTRRWFRSHGWHTQSGTCYGQVYVFRDDMTIEINPVIFPEKVCFESQDEYTLLTHDELIKLWELAKHNQKALEEVRKNKK